MQKASSKQQRRPCVQELLSGEIDPQSDEFWASFARSLDVTDEEDGKEFDRRAVINLKLLFSPQKLTKDRIQTLTLLVGKKGLLLKNEFTNDIGDLFLQLLIRDKGAHENQCIEYSNAVRQLCSKNPMIKKSLFQCIIDPFVRWIYDGTELSHRIISELFLLNITLISGQESVRSEFKKHVSLVHFTGAAKLIQTCNDSTAQITIAEWIWRGARLIDCSGSEISKALGNISPIVDVPKETFRGSLHDFIVSINGEPSESSKIIHIPFTKLSIDDTTIDCSGCFDINEDNVAFFFNQKPRNIPDVVIFRSNFIIQSLAGKKEISFFTREKTQAFKVNAKKSTTEYKITLDKKNVKDVAIKEFTKRLKRTKIDRRGADLSAAVTPQQVRAVAPKNAPTVRRKIQEYEAQETIRDENKTSEKRTKQKQKSIDINEIEQKLDEYAANSHKSIEQAFDTFIHKTTDVIDELSTIQNSLTQLLAQHDETTKCTTRENASLSSTVAKLQKEFESRHNESIAKRESIRKAALDAIEMDKKDITARASDAFSTNAIVGFTAALDDLPQRLQNMQMV